MSFATQRGWLGRRAVDLSVRLVISASLMVVAGGLGAPAALAAGTAFQRGDVFLAGGGNVQEYSPTGQLQRAISRTSGATSLCFDRSGRHLILPGVGLFDRSGKVIASNWASVTSTGRCVADAFGHVYLPGAGLSITRYNIRGRRLKTFTVTAPASAIDLAPDGCTMYYGSRQFGSTGINRLDVCTNTPEPQFNKDTFVDDLRILPNGQVLVTDDSAGALFDASGQFVRSYTLPGGFGNPISDSLRTMSLDPDGTSFWMSSWIAGVVRFDINSGTFLSEWGTGPPPNHVHQPTSGPIAVFGPAPRRQRPRREGGLPPSRSASEAT